MNQKLQGGIFMRKIVILMVLSLVIVGCGSKQQDDVVENEQKTNDIVSEEVIEEDTEEIDTENTENDDSVVIIEKEAKVDGEDFRIVVSQNKDGKLDMVFYITAKTEEKGAFILTLLCYLAEPLKDETDCSGISIFVTVSDMSVTYISSAETEYVIGTNRDGSASFGVPDWVSEAEEFSEDEMKSISEEISNVLSEIE